MATSSTENSTRATPFPSYETDWTGISSPAIICPLMGLNRIVGLLGPEQADTPSAIMSKATHNHFKFSCFILFSPF
jgi:hypothetical protein